MVGTVKVTDENTERLLRGETIRIRLRPGTTHIDMSLARLPDKGLLNKLIDKIFGEKRHDRQDAS